VVERLDEARGLEVRPVGDAGVDDVRAVARGDLGEGLDVVLEELELERASLCELAARVLLPHPGRRVVVARPLEEGDRAVRLGRRVECGARGERGRRSLACRGGRGLGGRWLRGRRLGGCRLGGLCRLGRRRRRGGFVASSAARCEERAQARGPGERDEAAPAHLSVHVHVNPLSLGRLREPLRPPGRVLTRREQGRPPPPSPLRSRSCARQPNGGPPRRRPRWACRALRRSADARRAARRW
jgi:hypothetical protein